MKTKLACVLLSLAVAIPAMATVPCVTNVVLTINPALTCELDPGWYGTDITNSGPNTWIGTGILGEVDDGSQCETAPPQCATVLTVRVNGNQSVPTQIGSITIQCFNGHGMTVAIMIPAYTAAIHYWFKYNCDGTATCSVSYCSLSQPDRAPPPEQ